MDTINKSKWQVRVAAIVIFLLGFAAGALALNATTMERGVGDASRQDRFERMLDSLHSTRPKNTSSSNSGRHETALQALRKIRARVMEIRGQADARLQKVLTPTNGNSFSKSEIKCATAIGVDEKILRQSLREQCCRSVPILAGS